MNLPPHQLPPFISVPPLKLALKIYEAWEKVPYYWRSDKPPQISLANPGTMYTIGRDFALEEAHKQAVKADDAEVPVMIWNNRIWQRQLHSEVALKNFLERYRSQCPLDSIRSLMLRYWRRAVCRGLLSYLRRDVGIDWKSRSAKQDRQIIAQGKDCLAQLTGGSGRDDPLSSSGGGPQSFNKWHSVDKICGCKNLFPPTNNHRGGSRTLRFTAKSRQIYSMWWPRVT